jgi:hypothetical protein
VRLALEGRAELDFQYIAVATDQAAPALRTKNAQRLE